MFLSCKVSVYNFQVRLLKTELLFLGGKCITEDQFFHSIVLLKGALWTALVGMHDTHASYLPKRGNVPNR